MYIERALKWMFENIFVCDYFCVCTNRRRSFGSGPLLQSSNRKVLSFNLYSTYFCAWRAYPKIFHFFYFFRACMMSPQGMFVMRSQVVNIPGRKSEITYKVIKKLALVLPSSVSSAFNVIANDKRNIDRQYFVHFFPSAKHNKQYYVSFKYLCWLRLIFWMYMNKNWLFSSCISQSHKSITQFEFTEML